MADEVPKAVRVPTQTNREHEQRQTHVHASARPQGTQPFRDDYPTNVTPRPPGGYAYQEKLQEARRASRPKSTPPRANRHHSRDTVPILISCGEEPNPRRSPSATARNAARKSPTGQNPKPSTGPQTGNQGQRQNRYPPGYRGPPPGPHRDPPPTHRQSPPENPRKAYTTKTPNFGPRLQPILKDDEWRKYPEVQVYIGPGVPTTVGLRTILAEFRQYGSMEYMSYDSGMIKIRMSEVHTAFWDKGVITLESGVTYQIKLIKQMSNFFNIASPTDHGKFYSDRFQFYACGLDFGFMIEPTKMMRMYEIPRGQHITFLVNFRRKNIEIRFKVVFKKVELEQGFKDLTLQDREEDEENLKSYDRTEYFKFEIPFSHLTHLIKPPVENDHERSFIIPSQSPPRYWRQLADWGKSIDSQKSFWSINDTWMRQTAIEYNMRIRRNQPIGLRHKTPVIDIGRWTTFRIRFMLDKPALKKYDAMMAGLNDFNVETKIEKYTVSDDRKSLKPIWDYIDQNITNSSFPSDVGMSWLDQLQQFEGPSVPYPVRYQLEVCISNDYLNEFNMTREFINELVKRNTKEAVMLLEHVADKQKKYFDPMEIFKIPLSEIKPGSTRTDLPSYCAIMRRATVTPSGIIYSSPSVDPTNRVIRHWDRYADRFMRVTFSDEKLYGRINWSDKQTTNELFSRIYQTLNKGIIIGDRPYEFLAFGNSQLREHGAYFFAPTDSLDTDDIRRWMGDFKDIDIVAKYASRLGQCFSTTRALKSGMLDIQEIPDIEHHDFVFSDGVGRISKLLAKRISWELELPLEASCFQFRLGGNKGVLAVETSLQGPDQVRTRPSQRKFDSAHVGLEIIRSSIFATASLNRQLITVLSTLGVPDEVFLVRMENMLHDYEQALIDPRKALQLLTKHIDPNQTTLIIAQLVKEGFMSSKEPYVMSLIYLWRAWTVKYLKDKAKIPVDQGAFVLGVVDETAKLRGYWKELGQNDLPEIFLQLTDPEKIPIGPDGKRLPSIEKEDQRRVITGPCVIARNPSLHPGDVRLVNAVDCPELHHLVDVVVFPQTGDRPIPTMLSGGDLDGDDYIVIWDEEFTSQMQNVEPASYSPSEPAKLGRDVQIRDVTAFFVNYMKNDRLGTIANNHLAWSDQLPEGVKSGICCELAALHSDAVDYPKTGVPAVMPHRLRCQKFPHFMEKDPDRSYQSHKILGQLYDLIERVDFIPCYHLDFDEGILKAYTVEEEMLEKARRLKSEHDAALKRILAQNGIRTEFEVMSTFVLKHSMGGDYKFHEELGRISSSHKERFRKRAKVEAGLEKNLPKFVAAMYQVTAEEFRRAKYALVKKEAYMPAVPMPMMSFPWIYPEILCRISKGYKSDGGVRAHEFNDNFEVIDPETGVAVPAPGPDTTDSPAPDIDTEDLLC
ncbi:RNA dependent RNA polymerase-domain-containing protein [Geopyxis carbonaria]|nr:RNA dependent RNA polymerase-domain-containing protein [Geopyxis carbonaria]